MKFKLDLLPCAKNVPAGEWPTGILPEHGPGDEVGIKPTGLGTWRGFDGELANRLEPGDGWGIIDGEGFMFDVKDGGDAILNEVAGLDEKVWWDGFACSKITHHLID